MTMPASVNYHVHRYYDSSLPFRMLDNSDILESKFRYEPLNASHAMLSKHRNLKRNQ